MMKRIWGGSLLAMAMLASSAQAKPANDVRCVYEMMSEEDREIALLLIVAELDRGNYRFEGTATGDEVELLVEEAHNKCLDHYNWTTGESGNAQTFAIFSLMREATGQLIILLEHDPAPIQRYFETNKKTLAALSDLNEKRLDGFAAELSASGWAKDTPNILSVAKQYLHLTWVQEKLQQDFRRGVFYR
jgi:hypothetical protein